MKKIHITILCLICLLACISFTMLSKRTKNDMDDFIPTPLVVKNTDIRETEKFKKEVSRRVQDILNGDIILTVYAEGVEDFCYRGKVKVINDGSDGTEVILIIHSEHKTMMDDVF